MRDILTSTGEEAAPPALEMLAVNKWFGQFHALRDIDLEVRQGERTVICSPSC